MPLCRTRPIFLSAPSDPHVNVIYININSDRHLRVKRGLQKNVKQFGINENREASLSDWKNCFDPKNSLVAAVAEAQAIKINQHIGFQ